MVGEQTPAQEQGGQGTVLVREDEEALRKITGLIFALRERGYTVLEAGNGEQALQVAAEHRGEIDLLLTDVVLPGMSGWEVGEKVGALQPGIAVLYVSGYSERLAGRGEHLLQKPFTPDRLLEAVRQALGQQAGS